MHNDPDMNAKYHQGRMDFVHGKTRMNVEDDRLSNLPDDLIHKILSFISLRQAIGMSVLSRRWKFIWTSMPYLNFEDFHTSSHFYKFVSKVLSRLNNQILVSSVKIVRRKPVRHESVKRILNYAFSHNVQQMTVTCDLEGNEVHALSGPLCAYPPFMATRTNDFPTLTTLHLDYIVILSDSDECTGLFSKCANLRNLSLSRFRLTGTDAINICHPQLSNLTLENPNMGLELVNIVTPQLKNLTITNCYGKQQISAPGLTSLVMKGDHHLQLSTKGFPCLEKVDLCLSEQPLEDRVHRKWIVFSTDACHLETNEGFPHSLFSSPSLKHLVLSGPLCEYFLITATPTWNLPFLTTLHLDQIILPDDCTSLFSKCTNLMNLSLSRCKMMGTNVLNIFHPRLSNLTLKDTYWWVKAFKVVTPQLKNLTAINCYGKHQISETGLTSLVMKGDHLLELSTKVLCSLEKVDLCLFDPPLEDAHKIVCLLQKLQSVKVLTLNFQILELLSSSMGLISHLHSPFPNLKILKSLTRDPSMVYLEVREHEIATTSTETKNHQQDTSPSSIFTKVSCEEVRIMSDIVSAQKLVALVRRLLEQCNNNAYMEGANAPMESSCKRKMREHVKAQVKKQLAVDQSAFEKQWHFGEIMAQIKQRKIEGLLTKLPVSETCHMISWLQRIEGLLIELPASKRLVMQAKFSIVCEEAAILSNNMLDCMKIQYNKKPRHCIYS